MAKCPKCNSELTKIVYGEPTPETFESAERGEIMLGGTAVLHLDIEQDMHPGAALFLDIGAGRAVVVVVVLRVLQQLVVADHTVKLHAGDKEIIDAVDFPIARLARCGGDGKAKVAPPLHHLGNDRALARPGRTGHDDQLSPVFIHRSLLLPPNAAQRSPA